MTAFDNTRLLKERHQLSHALEADEEERPSSEPWSPSSWDSGISLLDALKQPHSCKRPCNDEAFRSVEGKDTSSDSSVVCSERLPDVLMSKQEVLCFLNHELEQERIAAESAANEAISMIVRLQVEKAALQMEARHYRQVLEAKTLYDEETISRLHAIISSQEADRLVLEQEIDECRQTLLKYSETDTEKGLSGCKDVSKGLVRADTVPMFTQKTLHRTPSQGSGGSLRPLSLEGKFNHVAMQTMEDAQLLELSSIETRDETKTKYVVSMSTSDSTLNLNSGNSALEALGMTHGAYLKLHDSQNESLEPEGVKLDTQVKCLDDVVKDCWLSILMQLSKLYKQILKIEGLGIFGFEGDYRLATCRECSSESWNGFTQKQQAHMNSWCDIMAITDGCIRNLAEKFATCQSRFHALEAARRAMIEALEVTKENKRKADKVLVIAADMMRDFLSFTGLGCDILDLLHFLMTHLTTVVALVEDAKCAETDLSSKINTRALKQDDTLAADGKEPETVSSLIQGDSDLLQEMDCKMSKLAFLWSSSLEWMSNEKCRAETAFSGWDHI